MWKDNDKDFDVEKLSLWNVNFSEPLSKEKNNELILEYKQTEDTVKRQKLRDQIVYGNLRLAMKFINEKFYDEQEKDDLLQEMACSIVQAIESFNPDKGTAFSTYLTSAFNNDLRSLLRVKRKSKAEVGLYEKKNPQFEDEDALLYADTIEELYFDNSWVLDKTELDILFKDILPKFSKVEQDIFQKVFVEKQTFRQIAAEYNVSHQYISHIAKKIVCTIQKYYETGTLQTSKRIYRSKLVRSQAKGEAPIQKQPQKDGKTK